MKYFYQLETIDAIVLSQSNSTTNNHECLDYIPGSAILGAIASTLYPQLSDEDSWSFFHSGEIQYGSCYPIVNSEMTLPTPSAWHFPKGAMVVNKDAYQTDLITNHSCEHFARSTGEQYKQCRNGFISSQGLKGDVSLGITTKTAIETLTGKAKAGSLFSYAYIEAKQSFCGWVEYQTENQLALIKQHLLGEKRIGRSRNSEFGRVLISEIEQPKMTKSQPHKNQLVLWCLSDCECLNAMGQPNLTPKLNDLVDSAKGTLNVHRSFIRAATKSNFNQKRHGLDSDQILIAKGSVLVFDDVNINENQLLQLASQGIGINRQQGLGWIAVNPAWAFKDRYKDDNLYSPITVNNLIEKPNAPVNTTLNSPMINWIAVQVEQKKNTQDTVKSVNSLLVDVVTGYRTARRYNNILNAHEAGPSSSQWRRIADILRFNRSDSFDILFKGEHAICKETNDELGWGIKWDDGTQVISFSAYCENLFKTHSDQVILTFLEKLGRYDLSTYAGLKQACKELNLQLNSTGEGVNA